jgi:lysophospholipase L1-like esterase
MQAMNGSAGRGRLIGCCVALALVVSALVLAPVATAAEKPATTTYVAIGDSLAFGYTQEKSEENAPNEPPAYFENGYASEYAKLLKKENKGLVLVNNGCPGETTDSLFGTGPLGKAVDPTGTQACPYHFVLGLPLHTSLATLSQAENAISQLNPCFVKGSVCAPPHEIKMVTFNMAGNDELASIAKCKAEVKSEFEKTGTSQYEQPTDKENPDFKVKVADSVLGCVVVNSTEVFKHIIKNTETMLGLIRSPEYGNYSGPLKVLGVYNPQSFVLPGSDSLQNDLNNKLQKAVEPFGAKYANPMPKINPSPEGGPKEKKAIEKYTEFYNAKDVAANTAKCEANATKEAEAGKTVIYPCGGEGDIHPTLAGAKALAKLLFEA